MPSILLNLASFSASLVKLFKPFIYCISFSSPPKTLRLIVPGVLVE